MLIFIDLYCVCMSLLERNKQHGWSTSQRRWYSHHTISWGNYTTTFLLHFTCMSLFVSTPPLFAVKYVGSFPVDDRCLDDQIEQLHTQLKALRVSPQPFFKLIQNPLIFSLLFLQSDVQKEEACIHKILHQRCENVRWGWNRKYGGWFLFEQKLTHE